VPIQIFPVRFADRFTSIQRPPSDQDFFFGTCFPFLRALERANGDRLFSTLDLAAFAAGAALGLPSLVATHLILDIASRAFGLFALSLFGHRISFQIN
jgi:hypothetical protein